MSVSTPIKEEDQFWSKLFDFHKDLADRFILPDKLTEFSIRVLQFYGKHLICKTPKAFDPAYSETDVENKKRIAEEKDEMDKLKEEKIFKKLEESIKWHVKLNSEFEERTFVFPQKISSIGNAKKFVVDLRKEIDAQDANVIPFVINTGKAFMMIKALCKKQKISYIKFMKTECKTGWSISYIAIYTGFYNLTKKYSRFQNIVVESKYYLGVNLPHIRRRLQRKCALGQAARKFWTSTC